MALIQTLGPSTMMVAVFFGVLALSLAAVLVALLSDY
jgi:hypothetical protein